MTYILGIKYWATVMNRIKVTHISKGSEDKTNS